MSSEALPISPSRFAEALKSLPLSSLHLKVLELRNSIAHLDYSNEQLRPFAEGTSQPISSPSSPSQPQQPDQDCIDAIRENEQVIERMLERIRLVRIEVEDRGQKWEEFASKEEEKAGGEAGETNGETATNGEVNGTGERHSAWTDGTFQTGVIRGGGLEMDAVAGPRTGGTLSDEELRRRMEEQLRGLGDGQDDDDEEGMHL
ncbi:hypothetical protein B0T14DRAFT_491652 [Immersiella caudata]|uniref:Uncharacterized protein n=1 Tax=Immersiella caudata TaxID=314043 RepID=A0AA40CC91_9PEZI|nr:hypothetical protein B0T14DRAFT_491652 [Immersiella caudata]